MYDKFQVCTVDVQSATMIVNNPGANPALCTHAYECHDALHEVSVREEKFH